MSTSGAPPPPPPAPPSCSSSSSSSSAPLVTASRKCFNSNCTDFKSRRGWRLRSGDFAELCDRCATAYEQGKYCEFFHLHAMGWRCCESCGKRIHCGCIVSMHAFMVLDAGGIECIGCARKNSVPMSNPSWQTSMFYHGPLSERVKDFSVKSWSPLSGSGPVPFRQTATLFNGSTPHQELHQRLNGSETLSTSSLDNVYLKLGKRDIHENGIAGTNSKEQHGSCPSAYEMSSRDEPSTPHFGAAVPNGSTIEANQKVVRPWNSLWPTPPPSLAKQLHASTEAQIRNVRPRVDVRGRSQLSRYCPRITDEELQQISGNSNSTITPLFEKMLSASDAGKIGRLVLPKKCAEAYLPPISQPEGLPLKVQDSKGKEWVFQFRFWPNNNSRMYVLEGITPCIQNMKLQAGDIVTFSRLEPEGKLVMGFRKASTAASSDQDNTSKNGNRDSTSDANIIKPHAGEVTHLKDALESHGFPSINQELTDPNSSPWSKVDKSGYIAKEFIQAKSLTKRRKSSTLGSKSKRLRIENEDMIELKLTWEEAQGLLHPHPDNVPIVVEIEGFEFEEYEDAPVLGKPTILSSNNGGSLCSAVEDQQEDLLPSSDRAASKKGNTAKQGKRNVGAMQGLDTLANAAISGEHDQRLASPQATTRHPRHRPGCSCIVCIQPPSGAKHKQSCTCNVCQTVKRRFKTMMMKREKKQSDKDAETTANNQQQPLPESLVVGEPLSIDDAGTSNANNQKVVSVGSDDDSNRTRSSTSPFKGQIDLNMQPERDEELSPGSEPGSMMKMLQDATERCLKQQRLSSTDGDRTSTGNQILEGTQGMVENNGNKSSHQDPGKDHPARFS